MTEQSHLPAPRPPAPELDRFSRIGSWLAAAEVADPDEKQRAMAAALRLFYAESLELSPLAVAELSIIKGRLVISAQLLRALAARAGFRVVRLESTDTTCTAQLVDRDSGELQGQTTFTIEDARRAGLIRERSAWKTHPARMLWARASSLVVRDFAPEVALGLAIEDEVVEIVGENQDWVDKSDFEPRARPDPNSADGGLGDDVPPPPGLEAEQEAYEFKTPAGVGENDD